MIIKSKYLSEYQKWRILEHLFGGKSPAIRFENKRKNRFEAFLLKDGIPKPQKARDGSKSISQTWYDLGYFIGYLDVLPEEYHKSQFLRENEVLKPKKK